MARVGRLGAISSIGSIQDFSKVADDDDGCHDTEVGQGRERADQRGGGLGCQSKESQEGARHRLGSAPHLLTAMSPADLQDHGACSSGRMGSPRTKRCWAGSSPWRSTGCQRASLFQWRFAAEMWNDHEGDWEQESKEQFGFGYVGEFCWKCGRVGHYA